MDKKGIGAVGVIAAMVIAGLIVTGIIYYGPEILRGIQGVLPSGASEDLYDLKTTYTEEYVWSYLKNNYLGKEFKLKTVQISNNWKSTWISYLSSSASSLTVLSGEDDSEAVEPLEGSTSYQAVLVIGAYHEGNTIKVTYNDESQHTGKVTVQISESIYYQNPNPETLRYTASSTKDNTVFLWQIQSGVDFVIRVLAEPDPISDYFINLGSSAYKPSQVIHLVGGDLERYNLSNFDLTGTLGVENGYNVFYVSKVEPLSWQEYFNRISGSG